MMEAKKTKVQFSVSLFFVIIAVNMSCDEFYIFPVVLFSFFVFVFRVRFCLLVNYFAN